MIRQRDFTSLRPLIFVICVVYLLDTIGTIALTFTLDKSNKMKDAVFECAQSGRIMKCEKLGSSTAIQVLVWIECLLLLPIIVLCMLTLWSRAFVESLPGNTAFAIPISLILIFVLQIVFLIICLAKGYTRHHWHMDLMLFLQSLFALPVAYLFFNLPQINGDSEPPHLRDDRFTLLKNASARDKTGPSSNSSKLAAPAAKPTQPTSGGTATELPPSGTGTGSREEDGSVPQSHTGSKEPLGEPVLPVAPVSDPVAGTAKSEMSTGGDRSGKPAATGSKPSTPQPEPVPPPREIEDSESRKQKAKQEKEQLKSKGSASGTKSASDRLKHIKIVIPPKSKSKSSRSGVA